MDAEQEQKNYELAEKLLSEENFAVAMVAGIVAMILAAATYAVIVIAGGGYSVGFMAAGIGAVVGLAMQYLGRGVRLRFAIAASILAIVGIFLGNVFTIAIPAAYAPGASILGVLSRIPIGDIPELLFTDMLHTTLIYWMVAIAAAAYFARRRLSRDEGLALYLYDSRTDDAES